MRVILFIATFVYLALAPAWAQQASATGSNMDGLNCFENLGTPEFPKTALQSRIDGSVWTWTKVNDQGAIEKIENQVVTAWSEGNKLLTAPVEAAIRAARIKPECKGKTVWVVFRYQLNGQPTAAPKATSRADGQNILWIESQPLAAAGAGKQG